MKIQSSIQQHQVEALGLGFYQPRWLKLPWQSDADKQLDVAEVASNLNAGKTDLKVQLGEKRWPVASAADFRALAQLQNNTDDAEAPSLSRQLSGLAQAGLSVSGMSAYPAYLSLRSGESVEIQNSRGLPVARLSGQDLESQLASALERQQQLEKVLSSGDLGQVSLALWDQSQHSSRTFKDLNKSLPAQRFFERTQALGPEQQREWFALACQPVKGVSYEEKLELLAALNLTLRPVDPLAPVVLQAASWMRREDPQAPLSGPLQKIQRQAGEKFAESLALLPQLPPGEDWSGVGVLANGSAEVPLARRAEVYRQASLSCLDEGLQSEAFAQVVSGKLPIESAALLHQSLGGLKGSLQPQAWRTLAAQLPQQPSQALWAGAFAAASQDPAWAAAQVWKGPLPTAGTLSDLRRCKIPADFPAREALSQTIEGLLLKGRFLSSFGPALNRLVERIRNEKLSSEEAMQLLHGFSQLTQFGQTALADKHSLASAEAVDERERSKAWDRALVEEPKRMTAWAQVGAARQLGMHGGPGLQNEPEMAEPTMKLFRTIANGDKTCEQAVAQVRSLVQHLDQVGVSEPKLAVAYLESYQKLTGLGHHPEATLRGLDDMLKRLDPSEKFRDNPGKCLSDAVELSLLAPATPAPAVEIKETKQTVTIGGIQINKKKAGSG